MNDPDSAPLSPFPNNTARRRSLFWPGFALGFLLLSALICGSLTVAMGLTDISLADIQGGGPEWTPPAVTPTPVEVLASQQESLIDAGITPSFQAGDRVRNVTSSRVNIRQTPGYQGKPAGDILAQMEPGDALEVLGEAALADGLVWWRIQYTTSEGRAIEGWVAEATASGVTILAAAN